MIDFFRKRFSGNKREIVESDMNSQKELLFSFDLKQTYYDLLIKFGIDANGESHYKDGFDFIDKDAAEKYVEEKIVRIYDIIELEINVYISDYKNRIFEELASIEAEIVKCNNKLSYTDENTYLNQIERKIEEAKKNQKELEGFSFPEKVLYKNIGAMLKLFEDNLKKIIDNSREDTSTISTILEQRVSYLFTKRQFSEFKKKVDSVRHKIHSYYYPPQRPYYITFFFFCSLLLLSEIGFSISIIRNLISSPFGMEWDGIFAGFYSIGISLSLAIIFKNLIDSLLFKSAGLAVVFWVICFFIFGLLVVLFSYQTNGQVFSLEAVSNNGIILGFFSCAFSISNAFLFREASYLHHLDKKVNGEFSLEKLTKDKEEFINYWNLKLLELSENKDILIRKIENFKSIEEGKDFKILIEKYKQMGIASFWKGFDKKRFEIISDNQEILLVLSKKFKDLKLFQS